MPELIRRIKSVWPNNLLLLVPATLLLCVVMTLALVLALSVERAGPDPGLEETATPAAASEAPPALLVTGEQIAQLSYTDSALGELHWSLSQESLLELNQTLVKYNIVTTQEICHFLAQATVETGAGRQLTESGDEAYFRQRGYTAGTRGAGYLHLTHEYGQMAFATWMMKRYVEPLGEIDFYNPANHGRESIATAYYTALQAAANLGLDISAYSRIVYDPHSQVVTGADYIAEHYAWESAGYYWTITGIGAVVSSLDEGGGTDAVSRLVGGTNWQSRREAYEAFYPVLSGVEGDG